MIGGDGVTLSGAQWRNGQQGLLQSRQALTLALSGRLDNQDGTLAASGATRLAADALDNRGGTIQSLDALDIRVAQKLDNGGGQIFSRLAQSLQAASIINAKGWLSPCRRPASSTRRAGLVASSAGARAPGILIMPAAVCRASRR
nr:hypothetical protein [Pantoea sp. 1.19]